MEATSVAATLDSSKPWGRSSVRRANAITTTMKHRGMRRHLSDRRGGRRGMKHRHRHCLAQPNTGLAPPPPPSPPPRPVWRHRSCRNRPPSSGQGNGPQPRDGGTRSEQHRREWGEMGKGETTGFGGKSVIVDLPPVSFLATCLSFTENASMHNSRVTG